MRRLAFAATLVAALVLGGCASQPSGLYGWGPYPAAVATALRSSGGDAARQAAALEALLQQNAAAGRALPPGLHAHLALLYTQLRDEAAAIGHLEAEKRLFPESATYVDFLLANARKSLTPALAPVTGVKP
jgi:hypothetical protein